MTAAKSPPDPNPPVLQIYRWDLDKTYLKTEFETVRGLIRTALQKPEEKLNVPGAVSLLRELKVLADQGALSASKSYQPWRRTVVGTRVDED